MALLGAVFVPAVSAVEKMDNKKIIEIAEKYVKDISNEYYDYADWKNCYIEKDYTFYDPFGQINAYSYQLFDSKKNQGYILIGSKSEDYKLLEFSKGNIIPEENIESIKRVIQSETGRDIQINSDKEISMIYCGPFSYFVKYENPDSKEELIFDLYAQEFLSKKEITLLNDDYITYKKEKNLVVGTNAEQDLLTKSKSVRGTVFISNLNDVPFYQQPSHLPSSCAPVAAAMILAYWSENGYPNIETGNSDGTELIESLCDSMHTIIGYGSGKGTAFSNVGPGIRTEISNSGYSFNTVGDNTWLYYSWAKSEIDNDYPFFMELFNCGVWTKHCVSAIGYKEGSSGDFITVHTGWSDMSNKEIAWGSWWGASAVYVHPT